MIALLFAGTCLLASCSASATYGQDPAAEATTKAPVEYGSVQWERRLEPALARSAKSSKPVVLCFQEVPG